MVSQLKIVLIKDKMCPSVPTHCFNNSACDTCTRWWENGEKLQSKFGCFGLGLQEGIWNTWITHTYTRICNIHTYIHIYIYICTYTRLHKIHIRIYKYAHTPTHIHTNITHLHTCDIYIHIQHKHTHIYAYIQHTHTQTTYMHKYNIHKQHT